MARFEIKFENLYPAEAKRIMDKLDQAPFLVYGKIAGPAAFGHYDGITVWSLVDAQFIIQLLELEAHA